jgi:hypothetical protein
MNRLKQEIQVKDSSPSLSSLSFFVPPFNAFAFWHCSKSHGAPEEVLFLQTNGFFEDQAPHLLKRLADIARLVSYTKMSVCCFLILIVDQHVRILLVPGWDTSGRLSLINSRQVSCSEREVGDNGASRSIAGPQ